MKVSYKKISTFKSLGNRKRRNKGNFMLKSNANKIMLCGVGGEGKGAALSCFK